MIKLALFILAFILFIGDAKAQEDKGLVFDTLTIDLKSIAEDAEPVKAAFRYTNISNAPIVITRIPKFCGCTTTSYSKKNNTSQ